MQEQPDRRRQQLSEALKIIRDSLDLFEQEASGLASSAERSYLMYAAAAMSRSSRLWRAADDLRGNGLPEGVGLLTRAAWETWLAGTYLVLGGARAQLALAHQQILHDTKVAGQNGLHDVPALVLRRRELDETERLRQVREEGRSNNDTSPVTYDALEVEKMARLVQQLLAAEGRYEDVHNVYDVLYRSHSAWDVHGMAVLEAHLYYDEVADAVNLKPFKRWLEPAASLAVVGTHLVLLEYYVFREFGVRTAQVEEFYEALTSALDDGEPTQIANI